MKRLSLALLLALLAGGAQALEQGERLAPWTLLDQYEKPYSLDNQLGLLLVARDMDGAKLVKAALDGKPKDFLEQRHAVFVADISRMPSVISKLFAVPAMQDYNYRVLLDRESRVAPRYEAPEGQVLVLTLRDGMLQGQKAFASAESLRAALDAVPPAP